MVVLGESIAPEAKDTSSENALLLLPRTSAYAKAVPLQPHSLKLVHNQGCCSVTCVSTQASSKSKPVRLSSNLKSLPTKGADVSTDVIGNELP
jgi:hypothetical protein